MTDKAIAPRKRLAEEASSSSKRARFNREDLPVSEMNIQKMIDSGYYSDKTECAWRLMKNGGPRFLIRPRR